MFNNQRISCLSSTTAFFVPLLKVKCQQSSTNISRRTENPITHSRLTRNGNRSYGARILDTDNARITFESPETVRKRGVAFRLRREIEAMNYVQSHTSIPIPLVLDVYYDSDEHADESWILMSRLPGRQLGEVWPNMSKSARAQTILQLKSYLEQLHRLQHLAMDGLGLAQTARRTTTGSTIDPRVGHLRPSENSTTFSSLQLRKV